MKAVAFLVSTRRGQAVISLVGAAAIVAMAAFSYRTIDRELTQAALERRSALSYLAANLLAEKFDRLIDIGTSLASRVRFRELVEARDWSAAGKILSDVPTDFPFINRITLNDLHGTLVADMPAIAAVSGQNFAFRDWFKAVTTTGRPYISQVFVRKALPALNVFVAAVPIRSHSGALLGLLVLQVRLDKFFDWIASVDVGPEGLLYVVDRLGKLASHPKVQPQGELVDYSSAPLVQRLLQGNRGIEVAVNPLEKKELVVAYEPITRYGWGIVLEQPAATVFAARDEQLQRILFTYGLILLLVGIVAYLASRVIVERGQAQAAMLEQATVLQSILDNLGDGVTVTDQRMKVLLINPVARKIIGLGPADAPPANWAAVEGRYLPDMVTPFPPERLFITRALRGESVDDEEVFIRNHRFPAGLWLSGTARPIVAKDAITQAVVVWRDITERRRVESDVRALNTELEQHAAKLAAANKELESFSYSVSHDLRSPLRAIDGFSKILEDEYGGQLDDEARRVIGIIRTNAQKMAMLIDDLLEFSRLGRRALVPVHIDMNQLVEEVVRDIRAAHDGGTLQIVVSDLPAAWGDRTILKQAWINLLSNAVKFSGKADAPLVRVSGQVNAAENVYNVADNGAGFDMRYYNKLFGVFERLHSATEFAGTGVGLAIVHRVVSRHGGRVWAESKPNHGATFFFSLPRGAHNA